MTDIQKNIKTIAEKYHIQIIYAFGSRAKETWTLESFRIIH
jgi:hypothetical protein